MSWERALVVAAVILVAALAATAVDRALARRALDPGAATRYGVLRRTIRTTIVAVGVLSALLALEPVRAIAGGILASSAVLALVVGFAAQRTLANAVAGILIAFTQPLRIGDRVEIDGAVGDVEEIGLSYTFIRLEDRSRLVIPNEKLASDTIRNSTIVSREKVAEVTLQVPLSHELGRVLDVLRRDVVGEREGDARLTSLDGTATIALRAPAVDEDAAERLEHELRLRAHERLRAEGIFA